MQTTQQTEEMQIRQKRTETLCGAWKLLVTAGVLSEERQRLCPALVTKVVEQYVADLRILKLRYGIVDKIQPCKIAGLMTASIERYRPVIPLADQYKDRREFFANELLAIYHGLAICAEHADPDRWRFTQDEQFDAWMTNFVYLLHFRLYTAESLILAYNTLTTWVVPPAKSAKG